MKIGGKTPTVAEEILALPRTNGDIIVKARAVLDMAMFESLVPMPTPPKVMKAGEGFKEDTTAESFVAQIKRRNDLRLDFIAINSLYEIEWDEVDLDKPNTWPKWSEELENAGLSDMERKRIFLAVLNANSLDDRKLELAREAFLRGQAREAERLSGQDIEPQSTPSEGPAPESE